MDKGRQAETQATASVECGNRLVLGEVEDSRGRQGDPYSELGRSRFILCRLYGIGTTGVILVYLFGL